MQITLEELLEAREARVAKQRELIGTHGVPLVCFTMNIAGPVKTSPLIERAFGEGVLAILAVIDPQTVLEKREEHGRCGPVFFCAVQSDARELKARMVKIEETHPIGRLFDIDVLDTDGQKLSRPSERGCFVCGAPGRACAAGRLHPVADLVAFTDKMIRTYLSDLDAARVAAIAKEALLREVYTAPKPGLVDPLSCGSHKDMTVADFERSAEALEPYFFACVRAGTAHKDEPREVAFLYLRALGLEAEKRMLAATCGVNTHKGAIFSLGTILGAIGRLMTPEGEMPQTDAILFEAAALAKDAVRGDLEGIDATTAGGRAYLLCGARGIRGEVADGFPSVRNIALPAYRMALKEGKNKNDAGVLTLLHLIANVFDTNLYKRGGEAGLDFAQRQARDLLAGDPSMDAVRQMDAAFTERNLSPGGCADLLAVTYFLTHLEDESGKG